jgi:hypothetical protein
MHITINTASQFRNEFHRAGRGGQFSYEALGLLFDLFEDIDPDYDLDVIAICCEFAENMPEAIADMYSIDGDVMDFLSNQTTVAGVTSSGAVVYAVF